MRVLPTVGWCFSLSKKFIQVVPWQTFSIVFLTLFSQITSLLAFFLPLKIVILLGSENIPHYFPLSWADLNRDILIAALSIATVCFYILFLVSQNAISRVTDQATSKVLSRNRKIELFHNQQSVANSAYKRYSRALAGLIFVILALLGLSIFYSWIAIAIIFYFILACLFVSILYHFSAKVRHRIDFEFSSVQSIVNGVGFFLVFGCLVADFIFWNPPNVIIAIVAVLLSRQAMSRATGVVADLAALQKQKGKLEALFFHGKVFIERGDRVKDTMWGMLMPDSRGDLIRATLRELMPSQTGSPAVQWLNVGVANVGALHLEFHDGVYLLKIFDVNRRSHAIHESTLITESMYGLPAPEFIGMMEVGKFHCILCRIPSGNTSVYGNKENLISVSKALLAVEPSSDLVDKYSRSKPMLWQRLNSSMLERLYVAAESPHDKRNMDMLMNRLPEIKGTLRSLPLSLIVNGINHCQIWVPENEDKPILLHWGRWDLAPLGAGWPVHSGLVNDLSVALSDIAKNRPEVDSYKPNSVEIAALSFALERECYSQRFPQALSLVSELVLRLEGNEC